MGHLDGNWLFWYCLGHSQDNQNNLAQAQYRYINMRDHQYLPPPMGTCSLKKILPEHPPISYWYWWLEWHIEWQCWRCWFLPGGKKMIKAWLRHEIKAINLQWSCKLLIMNTSKPRGNNINTSLTFLHIGSY